MRLLVRPRRQGQKTSAGACFNVTGRPNGAKGAPLSPGLRRTSPPEVKFRASIGSKRKENSPRARSRWVRHRHLLRSFESPRTAVSECWPISPSPFAHLASTTTRNFTATKRPPRTPPISLAQVLFLCAFTLKGFPRGLGPTYPCPSTVHMETFSTSAFNVLN